MIIRSGQRIQSSGVPIALALILSACGANVPQDAANSSANLSARIRGVMYKSDGPSAASLRNTAAPAGAHLTYYGGRVNAATSVVEVIWGAGSFDSHITSTATPSIASFYQQILNNGAGLTSFMESEYNTVNPTGTKTNQTIVNGGFSGQFTISPSVTSSTISDAQIQAEITAQVNAGRLPAPAHDAAGNGTTYYAVFFPQGKTITQGTSSSCVSGGFCAYHGTVAPAGSLGEFYYGVHPDMQSGSGCFTGCGNSSVFGNYTSVTSHELVEMITDPEVGLAGPIGPPLAWYDSTNGEIGDICNAQQSSYSACDGQSYVVQNEFSNAQNNCIPFPAASCGAVTPDFTISAGAASITAGSSGSASVSTSLVGAAGTVSLSLSGVPTGVTASLAATSVAAGSGTTVNITVASTVAAGSYTITVNGTEGTKSHSANISLTVNPTGGGSGITNGGFESGLSGWTSAGTTSAVATSHSGSGAAQAGGTSPTNGDSSIKQTFTAPSGATQLSFWYQVHCPDTLTYDWATATLLDNTTAATTTPLAKTCSNAGAWVQVSSSVTAGHSYTLTLISHDDNYAGDPTYTWFDDVAFVTAAASDFSIAVATPKSVAVNSSVTSAVTTAITSGASESVAFSASGLPAGMTASFSPTSASSGSGSTLTLNAASSTATGSYNITVTGSAASGAHSATLALTVTPAVIGGISNGGFETGSFSGWTTSGSSSIVTAAHSGTYAAQLGTSSPTNGDSSAAQTFTAPTGSTRVSFWYKVTCPDTLTYDWATATLKDNTAGTAAATILAKTCTAAGAWTQVSATVTAGHSYTITLTSHDDNYTGDPTFTQYDDVVVQ